ncbi:hypothetical protein [Alkaliflexus imshenetskii]|uniref:hypothetical protein n=1 Tax=Alkaliflexus imshenetskii TaxID=286730 RepID=UPI000479C051|nr:hypothetical protein [Alkaliflexus imshenetskii]
MKKAGIVILIVGVILTVFTSVIFFTKEKVVEIGSLEITRDKKHDLNWSPLIGVTAMVVGGVMIWLGAKK